MSVSFFGFLLLGFQLGEAGLVGQGDIAFHQTVVEDVDFAMFHVGMITISQSIQLILSSLILFAICGVVDGNFG